MAVDAILMAEGAERKEQVASWTADTKHVSEYALNLQQLGDGVIIPPSGWKCSKCDKTENLWLNLTDGMILCGRRNWMAVVVTTTPLNTSMKQATLLL